MEHDPATGKWLKWKGPRLPRIGLGEGRIVLWLLCKSPQVSRSPSILSGLCAASTFAAARIRARRAEQSLEDRDRRMAGPGASAATTHPLRIERTARRPRRLCSARRGGRVEGGEGIAGHRGIVWTADTGVYSVLAGAQHCLTGLGAGSLSIWRHPATGSPRFAVGG